MFSGAPTEQMAGQAAVIAGALPGLLSAVIFFLTVREPMRRATVPGQQHRSHLAPGRHRRLATPVA